MGAEWDVRHKSRGKCLEEERENAHHAREVRAETRAQSQETQEERHDGEEQRDDIECPSEPAQIVELCRPNKRSRHTRRRAEIQRRVKRLRGMRRPAVLVQPIAHAADGEVGPARRVLVLRVAVLDPAGRCLEEVDLVCRAADMAAGEDDEEFHYDAAGEEEEGGEAEDGACDGHDGVWGRCCAIGGVSRVVLACVVQKVRWLCAYCRSSWCGARRGCSLVGALWVVSD